jgi:hypothetical protein
MFFLIDSDGSTTKNIRGNGGTISAMYGDIIRIYNMIVEYTTG